MTNEPIQQKEISQIFHRMAAIYGHKFLSQFPDAKMLEVAKREWSRTLSGLSYFQIEQGLDRCSKIPNWNPSIPEFIRLATNLPTLGQAQERVINKKYIDPVSLKIAREIGSHDLKTKSEKELRKIIINLFDDAYLHGLGLVWGKSSNWKKDKEIEDKKNVDDKPADKEKQKACMEKFWEENPGLNQIRKEQADYDENKLLDDLKNENP